MHPPHGNPNVPMRWGMALSGLDQDSFQKYIVGVFRSALDFRDCTRADDPKDRYNAPLLDWWKVLTEGMQRAQLEIAKSVQKTEDVKRWAEKSLSPMLGLLCAHPDAGEKWLVGISADSPRCGTTDHASRVG
jgi:hypothetical protein